MSQKKPNERCVTGCGSVATERNRYFTGKYMTARDFAGEQQYFLSRQRLHNRLLHGWGVVCGLRVLHYPHEGDNTCKEGWAVVKAGVAIDCCGREIFLTEDTPIEIPVDQLPPLDDTGAPGAGSGKPKEQKEAIKVAEQRSKGRTGRGRRDDGPSAPDREEGGGEHGHHGGHGGHHPPPVDGWLLCLRYEEVEIEPVPALYAEGQCDPAHQEPNRVCERARLDFIPLSEVQPGCWLMPSGTQDGLPGCKDDCDKPLPGPSGGCLEPDCPCDHCVPLALVYRVPATNPGEPRFGIDMRGRRHLPTPPHYLTHVVGINWPHGGDLSLRDLRERMGGQLRIRFDRKLLPADECADGTGVNRRTFVVQYGGVQRHLEFLPSDEDNEPWLEDDQCTAVFPIAHEYLRGRENIAEHFVYVTLHCDFVLDCHELPVDGNHLRGRLPSGNGTLGGQFLSWFRVVHHHHDEEND